MQDDIQISKTNTDPKRFQKHSANHLPQKKNGERVLIAGTGSGCGKTTVTIALLSAFKARGIALSAFKCGPDYIDPMFHRHALEIPSRNLDPYFCGDESLRTQLAAAKDSLSIIEGVMGYYDGIGTEGWASTWEVAQKTGTPVILVVNPRGMYTSVGAILKGFREFREKSGIQGVIFNGISPMLYNGLKSIAEAQGLIPLGFLAFNEEISINSRHLGLVTAGEIRDVQDKIQKLGQMAEKQIDLNGILTLAATVNGETGPTAVTAEPAMDATEATEAIEAAEAANTMNTMKMVTRETATKALRPLTEAEAEASANKNHLACRKKSKKISIAIARDLAFCFLYQENLEILESLGCELLFFSPLKDEAIPKKAAGLYLPGGYPELYARELSQNQKMLQSVRQRIKAGLPTIAECGGFLYLHNRLDDCEMAEVIPANAYKTKKLQRFGYVELTARKNNLLCKKGETIRAHEFHYWNSTDPGEDFTADKPSGSKRYPCIHASDKLYAGFPHLYFPANPAFAENFVKEASKYEIEK